MSVGKWMKFLYIETLRSDLQFYNPKPLDFNSSIDLVVLIIILQKLLHSINVLLFHSLLYFYFYPLTKYINELKLYFNIHNGSFLSLWRIFAL